MAEQLERLPDRYLDLLSVVQILGYAREIAN